MYRSLIEFEKALARDQKTTPAASQSATASAARHDAPLRVPDRSVPRLDRDDRKDSH